MLANILAAFIIIGILASPFLIGWCIGWLYYWLFD